MARNYLLACGITLRSYFNVHFYVLFLFVVWTDLNLSQEQQIINIYWQKYVVFYTTKPKITPYI